MSREDVFFIVGLLWMLNLGTWIVIKMWERGRR